MAGGGFNHDSPKALPLCGSEGTEVGTNDHSPRKPQKQRRTSAHGQDSLSVLLQAADPKSLCPSSPIFKFPLSIQVLGIPLGQRLTNSLPVSWSPIPCSRPSSMSCLEDSQVLLTTPCLSGSSFSHRLTTPKDPKSTLYLGGCVASLILASSKRVVSLSLAASEILQEPLLLPQTQSLLVLSSWDACYFLCHPPKLSPSHPMISQSPSLRSLQH